MSAKIDIKIPKTITKQLKLQSCAAGKKLVISTNYLKLYGFEKDVKIKEELINENEGLKIRLASKDDVKIKKVYQRTYKTRRNNPLETMLDIRGQELLNKAFPNETTTVHITFKFGTIIIKPIKNIVYDAIKRFRELKNPLNTMLVCSSGIDGYCLEQNNYNIDSLIELRVIEKRDTVNFEETGVLNALNNLNINHVFNEDLYKIEIEKMQEILQNKTIGFLHISLLCTEFTNNKAKSLKEKSIEDLSTSIDMFIDCLNIIKTFMPVTILVENAKEFYNSVENKIFTTRLRRLGYEIYDEVYDARDYNSLSRRERTYIFATLLPFEYLKPNKQARSDLKLWDKYIYPLIKENKLREVTHSKSIQDGIKCGRARIIDKNSLYSPTVVKSVMRMAKDSIIIKDEEKLYFPNNELLTTLMNIPESFNFDAVAQVIASEIIGQSIAYNMHEEIIKSIKDYLELSHARLNNRLF